MTPKQVSALNGIGFLWSVKKTKNAHESNMTGMDTKYESIATKHENRPNENHESSELFDIHQHDCDNKWRCDNCEKAYFDTPEDAWKHVFVCAELGAYECDKFKQQQV